MSEFKSKFQSEFEILKYLGKGGYGIVLKVKNIADNNEYAIKRVDLTDEPDILAERELKIKYCDHKNIVKYSNHIWIEQPEQPPLKWKNI